MVNSYGSSWDQGTGCETFGIEWSSGILHELLLASVTFLFTEKGN